MTRIAQSLRRRTIDALYVVKRRLLRAAPALDRVGLRRLRVVEVAHARELLGQGVEDLRVLVPGGPVRFASPRDADFLKIAKYYPEGTYVRRDAFVCDVPDGLVHVGTGLVLTAGGTVVEESVLAYRLPFTTVYEGLRPLRPLRVAGSVATILNVFGDNVWHWLVDSLPRLVSLSRAVPTDPVTLLVPDTLHAAEREVLAPLLPPNFSLRVLPKRTWVRADRVILPSFLSGHANGHLPADYVEEIRRRILSGLGLPAEPEPRGPVWISRRGDRHRRIRNEDAVVSALAPRGFRSVRLTELPTREQIETFRTASAIVGTYGAGLAWLLFSGRIPVVVVYPNVPPNTHFLTQTASLGQRHYYLVHGAPDEYSDFDADVPGLASVVDTALAESLAPTQ